MLLLDLSLVGLGAVVGGWACRRLGVPEVLGYLGAGVLLGPGLHPGNAFVDEDLIGAIAAFAVLFRMFTLGLDFDARRLRGRWRPALTAGILEMGVCTAAGVALALVVGWPLLEGAVLGAALGTTSTNILSRALADRNMNAREDARAAGAVTLTEDLIAMGLLALLTVAAGDRSSIWENATGLLVFASLAFTAGAIFVPMALDRLGRSRSDELLTLAVIGILFGFAALSDALGAKYALGAFLAGITVAAARHAPGVSARVLPLRDLLAAVAYVSIGLLLDPATILRVAPLAMAVAAACVVLKAAAVAAGLRLGGVPAVTSARAGAILGQAGTMGLVFVCRGFLDETLFPTIMATAFVAWAFTVALTPLRLRWGPDLAEAVARAMGARDVPPRSTRLHRPAAPEARGAAYTLLLAVGCSATLAALAALVARADDAVLPAQWRAPAAAVAGLLAGFALLPFALVAGVAARRLAHRRAHDAILGPRRLARHADDGQRALSHGGAVLGVAAGLAAPAVMLLAVAPPGLRLWLLAAAGAGGALACLRPGLLARLVDECERLTAPRAEPMADLRLHDFRGVSPFGFEVEAVLVRSGTRAANRTLRDLQLPERTGARVVALLRAGAHDGQAVGPDTLLRPGDETVLGGTPAQLESAKRLLLEALVPDAPPAPAVGVPRPTRPAG